MMGKFCAFALCTTFEGKVIGSEFEITTPGNLSFNDFKVDIIAQESTYKTYHPVDINVWRLIDPISLVGPSDKLDELRTFPRLS